ncbi:MAG: FecR family protein [Lentisphaeraceae bacterium]|nr:FecR family protein [Lentisphaeraceae bacterium]
MNRLEELTLQKLDCGLSKIEENELLALIEDSENYESFINLLLLESQIQDYYDAPKPDQLESIMDGIFNYQESVSRKMVKPPISRVSKVPKKKRLYWPWVLAACFLVGFTALYKFPIQDSKVATIVKIDGEIYDSKGQILKAGQAIAANELIEVRKGTFNYTDTFGGSVTIQKDSKARFLSKDNKYRAEISGKADFSVQKQRGKTYIVKTPTADMEVVGTEFDIQADGEFSTVKVSEGKVKFHNSYSNAAVVIPAGHFATNKNKILRFGKQLYSDTDIKKIVLVNAKDDKEIAFDQLYDGITIPYTLANSMRLNIRIFVSKGIKSMRVSHDGNEEHIQNDFPYTTLRINKALQDTYNVWTRGAHYITILPFKEKEGIGPIGEPITLKFFIK